LEFFELLHKFESNLRKQFEFTKLEEESYSSRPMIAGHRTAWALASRWAASRTFSRAPRNASAMTRAFQ
jgi:hypothetical protein